MFDFASLWKSGSFKKIGRVEAEKRFISSVRTETDWADIQRANHAYTVYCRENTWYHAQLGSVWFGKVKGWRQWVPEEFELKVDEAEPEKQKKDPIREILTRGDKPPDWAPMTKEEMEQIRKEIYDQRGSARPVGKVPVP
jgi:hypothetical protein